MPPGHRLRFAAFDQLSAGVRPRRLQKPVAHRGPDGGGHHHRLGDEAIDCAKDESLANCRACYHCPRSLKSKMADEHCEPAKHDAFYPGQQSVTPVERGL
jgi:hypothetical protein